MLERTSYPAGVPCFVDTIQPDPEAAMAFYGGLFGWEFDDVMPADSPGRYFIARLQGLTVAAIGGPLDPSAATAGWNTYVAVESADATAARIRDAGGRVVAEPTDVLDAGRMGVFADPTGAVFSVWEARKHIGAQLVNEPGTWVLKDLNTRDPEAAGAFYRAVFGWEVESFGMGDSSFTMLRLPGYGEFLRAGDPEILDRQEGDGAPAGYADAIGFLIELTDEHPADVPAHWGVTFATDDADATASRAEALGGTVVVPPFDAEPVRMTVLTDPQGAQFTATKYQPGQAGA